MEPGGSANFLFMLSAEHPAGEQGTGQGLTGALGKLEIRWRSSSAALGRLQTQQIVASTAAPKDIGLTLHSLPQARCSCLSLPCRASVKGIITLESQMCVPRWTRVWSVFVWSRMN